MIRAIFIAFLILLSLPAFAASEKVLDVQEIQSPGGISAWLVEDKSVPVISISFSFDGGLIYDPDDKPGVGRMVSILLDEGSGDMKSQDFQSQLANNAIHMKFTAGRDAFYGQIKTLKSNKDLAFSLLNMALTKPRFDTDAIERMKNANISQIKDDMGDPGWLVARSFNGMMFEGHFYARPGFGNLQSIPQITKKDLTNFTRAQFSTNVLKVAIAGDISKSEAMAALDVLFASLPTASDMPENENVTLLKYAGKTILLPLNVPQTFITVGAPGISYKDKDWHAAVIMNYILGGGGFDSRLMTEIREKRGLTYGVYSSLNTMKYTDTLQASLSCGNDKAEEALKILKQEWAKMAKDGATEQEVADAKAYLTGSLLLDLTSTDDISDTLNALQRDGLSSDYINTRNALINKISPEDIRHVAERLLKPESLMTIMVGQPKNITADIMLDQPPGMAMPVQKMNE